MKNSIILFIVLILPIIAHSEVIYSKDINNSSFFVSKNNQQITLSYSGISTVFNLSGYTANNCILVPDGKYFWVVFIDMAGQSAGGEVRTIFFNGNFKEIENDKSANHMTVKKYKNDHFLCLWQHDVDDLSYVSDILLVKNGLVRSTGKKIWHKLIQDYENKASNEKTLWKKSRYYSYIAMTYKIIGDISSANKNLKKARDFDSNNPWL
jgi:hypothetical protein